MSDITERRDIHQARRETERETEREKQREKQKRSPFSFLYLHNAELLEHELALARVHKRRHRCAPNRRQPQTLLSLFFLTLHALRHFVVASASSSSASEAASAAASAAAASAAEAAAAASAAV
jgi:hypothetical protein